MPQNFGFPVGTRVMLTKEDPHGQVPVGETGEVCDIVDINKFLYKCNIGVAWDREGNASYHDCNGQCKKGHGRYVPHTALSLVSIDLGEIVADNNDIYSLLV